MIYLRLLFCKPKVMAVCILALALAVHGRVLVAGLVNYDDGFFLADNSLVQQGLSLDGARQAFMEARASYIPLTTLTYMATCEFFGMHPSAHHAVNWLLHGLNAALLFLWLYGATGRRWPSALAAALFAIHPVHVEPVAWISSRKDVLSTCFLLLALLAYTRYARKPRFSAYLLMAFLYLCSLLSKPMMLSFPFLLLLLDYWPLNRAAAGGWMWRRAAWLVLEKAPLAVVAAGWVALTYWAQRDAGAMGEAMPVLARMGNGLAAYVRYIGLMCWPAGLSPFYPHLGASLPAAWIGGAAALLGATTVASLLLARRFPFLLVGWCWYLAALLPVSGILVQVGAQSMALRYLYVPALGLYLAAAWGIAALARRSRGGRIGVGILLAAAMPVLAALAWQNTGYWKNSVALWSHAVTLEPDNYMAQNSLGEALIQAGRPGEAVPHVRRALDGQPKLLNANNNMGMALAELGRSREAIPYYQKELEYNPRHAKALNNLGNACLGMGDSATAVAYFRRALSIEPALSDARVNMGAALVFQGDFDGAITCLRQAIHEVPNNAMARTNLAVAYLGKGMLAEAEHEAKEALRLEPSYEKANALLAHLRGMAAAP